MTRWFFLSPFTLTFGAVVGIWVVLICSPALRHVVWFLSAHGRRCRDFTPQWTRADFEGYLETRGHWFASTLSYALSCTACQSVHSGILGTVIYFALAPVPLRMVPLVFPLMIATFYTTYRKLTSHV